MIWIIGKIDARRNAGLRPAIYMEETYQGATRRGWEGAERKEGRASRVQGIKEDIYLTFCSYAVD